MEDKEVYFKPKIPYKERYHQESLIRNFKEHEVLHRLLDSSLISATNIKFVNLKVVDCNTYKHVYEYKKLRKITDKNLVKFKDKKVLPIDSYNKSYKNTNELQEISLKNIERTKIQFQRLIQCNLNTFKSFITLTFAENITDVNIANKKFANWRTRVKKIYKDFAYICVPEFQKRGAVHYHLLTNLEIGNSEIIVPQLGEENKYDVMYWKNGFSSVFSVNNINVIGYMSKYMTKDIDNRLFSKRRYFYSSNLIKPIEYQLDLSKLEDFRTYCLLFDKEYILKYSRDYEDFYGDEVKYKEYEYKEYILNDSSY